MYLWLLLRALRGPASSDSFSLRCILLVTDVLYSLVMTCDIIQTSTESASEGALYKCSVSSITLHFMSCFPASYSCFDLLVKVRLEAISKCAEALLNAIRLGDPGIIQAGCVTQWNLCLPLLQPNLRKHVRRPLTIVAEALEKMNRSLTRRSESLAL